MVRQPSSSLERSNKQPYSINFSVDLSSVWMDLYGFSYLVATLFQQQLLGFLLKHRALTNFPNCKNNGGKEQEMA